MLAKIQPVHWVNLPPFDKLLYSFVEQDLVGTRRALPCLRPHFDMKINVVPLRHLISLLRCLNHALLLPCTIALYSLHL